MRATRWGGRLRRAAAAGAMALAGVATVGTLAACDPCAGVLGRGTSRRASATGRVIDFKTGKGKGGVLLTFRRESGAELLASALGATTDADGHYTLSGEVRGEGDVVGTLTVRPPAPDAQYDIYDVRLAASTRGGQATALLPIFARPWLVFVGEFRLAATGQVVPFATVTFRRQRGADIPGNEFTMDADYGGRFYYETPGSGGQAAVGTFTVSGGGLARAYTIPDVGLSPLFYDTPPGPINGFWILGAQADGVLRLLDAATGEPFRDTEAEFVRTGGLPLVEDRIAFRTNGDGWQNLPLVLAEDVPGEVVGDITVRPAGKPARTLRGVRFATVDYEFYRIHGEYRVPAP